MFSGGAGGAGGNSVAAIKGDLKCPRVPTGLLLASDLQKRLQSAN